MNAEQLAKHLYETMPSRASHPSWDQLGETTKGVWIERANKMIQEQTERNPCGSDK